MSQPSVTTTHGTVIGVRNGAYGVFSGHSLRGGSDR